MSDRRNPAKPKKSKWYQKPLALPGINFYDHHLVGFSWLYINRMGTTYHTEMTDHGWTCECMGFTRWRKCKHITAVHERLIA